jgi:CRP/FNR family transcriptional regulator, cyclic AMP receptor protein
MFQQADLVETLQTIPWFVDLKPEQFTKMANIARLRQIGTGEELFAEGEKADCLYVLLEGEIVLSLYVPGCGETNVYTAEPLDILGWDPLTPVIRQRFGSAHSTKPCLLIALSGDSLRLLCEEDHELGFIVYRRLANIVAGRMLNIRLTMSDTIMRLSQA